MHSSSRKIITPQTLSHQAYNSSKKLKITCMLFSIGYSAYKLHYRTYWLDSDERAHFGSLHSMKEHHHL